MKVFLIGLPGSGKTTLGKQIAAALQSDFVDLDVEIERAEKRDIASLFALKGEEEFRRIERKHLNTWCANSLDFVMATGGGTPCFFENIKTINQSGLSVFLDLSLETIAERLRAEELSQRPLFRNETPATIVATLEKMRDSRIPFYQQASIALSGKEISGSEILKKIQDLKRKADREE